MKPVHRSLNKTYFLCAILALPLAACSKGGSGTATTSASAVDPNAPVAISGDQYRRDCSLNLSGGGYTITDLTLGTDQFTETVTSYSAADCKSSSLLGSVYTRNSYATLGQSPTDPTITFVNTKMVQLLMKSATDEASSVFNVQHICGGRWQTGAWRNMSSCKDYGPAIQNAKETHTILQKSGDKLLFGTDTGDHDGSSDARRDVELDTERVFHKI